MSEGPFQNRRLLGSLVGVLALVALGASARYVLLKMAAASRPIIHAAPESISSAPTTGAAVVQLPAFSVTPNGRRIFVCDNTRIAVYSDTPCDARRSNIVIDASRLNLYSGAAATPQEAVLVAPLGVLQSATTTVGAPVPLSAERRMQCEQIEADIRRLDARMRQRYTSEEGEQLRVTWHALSDARHAARCGR